MNKTYTIAHCHTMLSNGVTNIDSVTSYEDYINFIKENKDEYGINSICFTEHGSVFEWYKKKCAIESLGLKYIHSIEIYVTETLEEKKRDNYHVCLYAKNYDGFLELNKLSSKAFNREDGHYYYVPRITFNDLINTSDNIIITTACMGGILSKADDNIKNKFIDFLIKNKHRCYLEIQHHMVNDQIDYNKYLYNLHKETGIELIVATDTHALNAEHAKSRIILQKSKKIFFDNEEGWDLTLKSYDELFNLFKKQNIMSDNDIEIALNNTNKLYEQVEEFKIDKSYKYPKLSENPKETVRKKVIEGIKKKGIDKYDNFKTEYVPRIKHEMETYEHNKAFDFLLLDTEIKEWARNNDMYCGYSRGSVSGSVIAYLLGMTDIDSVRQKLNFERFMNVERVSLADVDTDWQPNHRELVKNYLYNRDGLHCCDIITFNTVALKGAIRDVGRALEIPLQEINDICSNIETEENELKYREKYKELFEYVDIINGTIVSIGTHPCGLVVSPITLDDHMGLCTISTSEHPVSMIYMKEIDAQNYVKLDILGLDNIQLINETCKLAGIERLTPENVPDEENVWLSMAEDNTLIFQWESDSAKEFLSNLLSKETLDKIKEKNPNFKYLDLVSMGNGAIRPAGASYREQLSKGEFRDNGHPALNELLKDTSGFLVYQCQILDFLHQFCGYTMGEADVVRRGFAKKTGTEQFIPKIKEGFIKTMKDKYNVDREESENLVVNFIQVIEDASSYLFSKNHSDPYTEIGYIDAYLRYYYPLEFLTTALNINIGKEEKTNKITEYINKIGIKISHPKFRYSKGKYFMDKENNTIYKGVGSIKYLNEEIGDELYNIKDIKANNFIELLPYIFNTKINSKQLDILIKLDYFSEFGNPNQLLKYVELYNQWYNRKTLKKDKLSEYNVTEEYMRKYANETEKQFNKIDNESILKDLASKVDTKTSVYDRLKYQHETCGYCYSKYKKYKGYGLILDVNTKYSLVITVYLIDSGKEIKYKVYKNTYKKNEIKVDDLIQIGSTTQKPKQKRIETYDEITGEKKYIYEPIEGEYNDWLLGWKKIN